MNTYSWFRNHEEEQQNEKTSAYEELWIENINLKDERRELQKKIQELETALGKFIIEKAQRAADNSEKQNTQWPI